VNRSIVVLLIVFTFLSLTWENNYSTIEIFREEDNGRMNMIPCIIDLSKVDTTKGKETGVLSYFVSGADGKKKNRMNKEGRLFLVGGDHAALKVEEGKYKIGVYTPTEYQGGYVSNNTETWRSNYLTIEFSGGKKFTLSVEPTAKDGEYDGGWKIHLVKK